ncbi:minor capsid protein [Deinococcus oregonensis]|uniref:Minor capsid protein n=1 Tax=Deinococcus oregonensis TaxID=1805970 RepID=A0ABV6AYD7_9DEIO
MTLTPEQKRLLAAGRRAEDAHLNRAKAAVVRQFQGVTLTQAEKALKAALSQPASRRAASVRAVLGSINEATSGTRVPPEALLGVMRRAVSDRVLNTTDLALLSDPKLLFGDSRELQAKAVARQRKDMNGYWAGETDRFRNDVAATVREAIRRGLDPEKAADLLQERLGVHRSRAVLIAVDQVSTAVARAEQSQLRAAGLKRFLWRTIGDQNVRPAHERLEGRVFTWRGAPELPGAAIRCRCRAMVPPSSADASP